MKKIIILSVLFLCVGRAFPQGLELNKYKCAHCNMIIKDSRFVVRGIHQDGTTLHFDAIECSINYLKEGKSNSIKKLEVADFTKSGNWIPAEKAFYLKSSKIPSPMGAYLSAYPDKSSASKIQKLKGGEIFTWDELKRKFNDAGFGLINHPDHHHERPDAYASIGVMGDHVHHKGGLMVSLRYMNMQMQGNQTGTESISDEEIYKTYMAVPQQMQMEMYMLGIMYAPGDKITLGLMQPFINNTMHMEMMQMGMPMKPMTYKTQSSGLADLKLTLIYSIWANEKTSIHLNTGISIPQGNTEKTDNTPMSENMKLPYSMQLGSGTWDFIFGATFKQSFKSSSMGFQPLALIRTGENIEGYRLGNRYQANLWYSYAAQKWLAVVGRVECTVQDGITGKDDELNPMMSPQANSANYGFEQAKLFIGTNFSFPESTFLKNVKLGLEAGIPFYRNVTGIQMTEKATVSGGLRYLF